MASVKLTGTMRDEILAKLLDHAFGDKERKLKEREAALAEKVYCDLYTPDERSAMEKVPEGWLPTVNHVTAKMGRDEDYFKRFTLGRNVRVPYKDYHGCKKVYEDTHPLAVEYQSLHAESEALKKDKEEIKRRAKATLGSVTMSGKLKALWPEISTFVEAIERRYGGSYHVPSTTIVELNNKLNLPPEQGEKRCA